MSDPQTAPYQSSPSPYPASSRRPVADLRLGSPAHLAGIGLGVWIVGVFVHVLAVLAPVGIALLLLAGIAQLVRPRARTMYWRGRALDLDDEPTAGTRVYRCIFKR